MDMTLKIHPMKIVTKLAWSLAVASYFLQVPYRWLAAYIIPSLAVYLISLFVRNAVIIINKNWLNTYVVYVAYILLMILFSILQSTALINLTRFTLILLVLPLFCIKRNDGFNFEYDAFILFAILKSFFIIYIAYDMFISGVNYRSWAYANGYGDIYISPFDHLPKVQVHGNGILPISYILSSLVCTKGKSMKNRFISITLLLGTILAGNAAFILGIALYYLFILFRYLHQTHKSNQMRWILILTILVLSVLFTVYSYKVMSAKADNSNAIRWEQIDALLNDSYILVGNGVGHNIKYSGSIRTYSTEDGAAYFELQTLYVLNQIGLIGMLLVYYLILSPFRKIGSEETAVFCIYIIYSFWNPYCFDTTEMMVATLLLNFSQIYSQKHTIRAFSN